MKVIDSKSSLPRIINYSDASTMTPADQTRSESNMIINVSLLTEKVHRERQCFTFGSKTLAIIYMANTMVIPEMNQIVEEIVFSSK
jgi:hypothetical protein